MTQKKKNISVRLCSADIKRAKDIANRLQVKESELLRFAIKHMLNRLMPLSDESFGGADLIPTWLDNGGDLMNFFDIDSEKLGEIFNAEPTQRDHSPVDVADVDLMILSNFNQSYAVKKLSQFFGYPVEPASVVESLQNYLYDKYILGKPLGFKTTDILTERYAKVAELT